jgi:hypothetical protein
MQFYISVVELLDEKVPTRKIIESGSIVDFDKKSKIGYIHSKEWIDDDDFIFNKHQVKTIDSFCLSITAEFIRDQENTSELNAYYISPGGFGNINRLAYHWSASIFEIPYSSSYFDSYLVWSKNGIKSTNFDMYSYHVNLGSKSKYVEDNLCFEVYESIDLHEILQDYLYKSDIRDSKLNGLGI